MDKAKVFQPALDTHGRSQKAFEAKMQNDSTEDIFVEQNNRRVEQIATVGLRHRFTRQSTSSRTVWMKHGKI